MSTRRQFLHTTALGIAAGTLPGLVREATPADANVRGSQAAGTSPPAIIDFHAHWIGPSVVDLLSKRASPRPPTGASWFDLDARLQHLDQVGIQRQVLSYVGAAYDGVIPPNEARPFWQAQNNDLAAVVRKHPKRFSGLATLPTASVASAAEELERAHRELGLIGATLPLDAFVTLAGAKALAPVFAVAQKHRSHIYVHRGAAGADIPGQHPEVGSTNAYFGLAAPDMAGQRPAATPGDNPSLARS